MKQLFAPAEDRKNPFLPIKKCLLPNSLLFSIMSKRSLQMVVRWTLCFFALLTQIGVAINAQDQNKDYLEKLPFSISIQRLKMGNIVLEVSNSTSKEKHLVSNLPQILDSLFLGFPTWGALQLRNANGTQISIRGQRADGWLWPNLYSSSLDLEKANNIKKLSDIKVKANDVQRYQIECENILTLAIKSRLDENNGPAKEFRLRLPLDVSTESGERVGIIVTSEWLPIADRQP